MEGGISSLIDKKLEEVLKAKEPILLQLLQESLNKIMVTEREEFLKENEDVGNGFYERGLTTSMGRLNLRVPRTRRGSFRSVFLPEHYVRAEESYNNLLKALITVGYSEAKLRNIISSLGILNSQTTIERLIEELKEKY